MVRRMEFKNTIKTKGLTISAKLILIYVLVFAIFLAVLTFYISYYSKNEIIDKEENEVVSNSISSSQYCSYVISNAEKIMEKISANDVVNDFLTKEDYGSNDAIKKACETKLTTTLAGFYKEVGFNFAYVESISVMSNRDTFNTFDGTTEFKYLSSEIASQEWYNKLLQARSYYWGETSYSVFTNDGTTNIMALYGFVSSSDFDNGKYDIVRIEIDLNYIANVYTSKIRSFYLVNHFGNIVYSSDKDLINTKYSEINKDFNPLIIKDNYYSGLGGERKFVAYNGFYSVTTPDDVWFTVFETYESDLLSSANSVLIYIILVSVLLFLIMFVLLLFLTNGITKRIKSLMQATTRVTGGDYSCKIDVEGQDEIAVLSEDFNQMVDKLNELVNETYKQRFELQDLEIKQRQAQIETFQNQINPHFLYNTLETIRMHALFEGNEEVADMLVLLAKMFRYNINLNNVNVKIADEIAYLQNYITMLNLRSKSNIVFKVDLSPDIMGCQIIKMTMQPLIENSIKHGFKNALEGEITVNGRVTEDGKKIEITIKDNGVGIDKARVEKMNKSLIENAEISDCLNVGLLNVNRRIKFYFGEEFGLKVEESSDGAVIKILIPYSKKGEEDA